MFTRTNGLIASQSMRSCIRQTKRIDRRRPTQRPHTADVVRKALAERYQPLRQCFPQSLRRAVVGRVALKLEASEPWQTRRRVHRPGARRTDTEERRERRVRLMTHGHIDVARRVHRVSDGAVVEEAGPEFFDGARFGRATNLRLAAAAGARRSAAAGAAGVAAADARVGRCTVGVRAAALERGVRGTVLLERSAGALAAIPRRARAARAVRRAPRK